MRSVRGKLLLVVAICLLPAMGATLVISGLYRHAQRALALDRIALAREAFNTELADDISDLRVAAQLLASDPDVARELAAQDRAILLNHIDDFTQVYPQMRVLLVGASGDVLATTDPLMSGGHLTLPWTDFHGVTLLPHADGGQDLTFSYAVVRPVSFQGKPVGVALASFPLNSSYLENTRAKTGLDLAFRRDHLILGRTSNSAALDDPLALDQSRIGEFGGRTYALNAFNPIDMASIEVVAALDITTETEALAATLRARLVALGLVALIALGVALWLSRGMTSAVASLVRVLPGVAERRYELVKDIRTRDELLTLAQVYNQMITRISDNDRWRTALGKYLSPGAQAAVERGEVHLGGSTMAATVLFSDIRSFTSLSEKLPPAQVLELLNRYFTEMVTAVTIHGGTVDKFIGDCVMAVWGPPTPGPLDALSAVKAGLAMRAALEALNLVFEREQLPKLRTGIGIHTGEVVAGNIGSEGRNGTNGRMEYTVIGDTVNLASRLEALTKELHVEFLISETTYAAVRDQIDAEPLSQVTVRGRTQSIQIYRVIGLTSEVRAAS